MHLIAIILLSIAVIGVTVFLFVGWVVVSLVRGTARVLFPDRPRRIAEAVRARFNPVPERVQCSRANCRNFNPPTARFCRCCGVNLLAATATQSGNEPVQRRMTA